MMSITQKTKKMVAILTLVSVLWVPIVSYCAAEADPRAREEQREAQKCWLALTPEEQEEVTGRLCDRIMSDWTTVESLRKWIGEKMIDVNASTSCGSRPLGLAAFFGKKDKVKLLLDRGADIDGVNQKGETALSLAVYGGHADIVALLLERGARMDIADLKGSTPLERVFFKSNRLTQWQILPILLKHAVRDEEVKDAIKKQIGGALTESARAEVMSQAESDKMAQELIECNQVKVTQQQYQDCGLQVLANAHAIDECLRKTGSVNDAAIREWHPDAYGAIAKYLGSRNGKRDIHLSHTAPSELMMVAKNLFGMSNNCCVVSLEFLRLCNTTLQSRDDLQLQLIDYSGPMTHNESIHKMIDDLHECDRGAVHFICGIKIGRSMIDSVDHWVLVSVVKEGATISMKYADSNNVPLEEHAAAQKVVECIRNTYAARLLA